MANIAMIIIRGNFFYISHYLQLFHLTKHNQKIKIIKSHNMKVTFYNKVKLALKCLIFYSR